MMFGSKFCIYKSLIIGNSCKLKQSIQSYRSMDIGNIMHEAERTFSVFSDQSNIFTESNQYHVLEDKITPLARTPYEIQLRMKKQFVEECIKELRMLEEFRCHPEIFPVAPSPAINHYRNKDEFDVNRGIDGEEKVFGFSSGRFKNGNVYAVRPYNLINIKKEHIEVLKIFENFVKKSPLPASYQLNDGGYWRRVTIRSNLKGDIMLIVVVQPRECSPQEIKNQQQQLLYHFQEHGIELYSVYYQVCKNVRCTDENSIITLIHGRPYLYETFMGKEFRISPNSFFQINVKAAEVMHEEINKMAQFCSTSTLLDLCCGVGAYSISFSDKVRNTVGIDYSLSSIEDALVNCKVNGTHNCEFTIGAAEERMQDIFHYLDNAGHLIVIVNSGRGGLHPRVVELLRGNPSVNKIFYISCIPNNSAAKRNFIKLLTKDKKQAKEFQLTSVKPVDMFPQTIHYELIMAFER